MPNLTGTIVFQADDIRLLIVAELESRYGIKVLEASDIKLGLGKTFPDIGEVQATIDLDTADIESRSQPGENP